MNDMNDEPAQYSNPLPLAYQANALYGLCCMYSNDGYLIIKALILSKYHRAVVIDFEQDITVLEILGPTFLDLHWKS